MTEMQFTIEISSSKENVWDTLWQDDTFRDWASIVDPETYMVGDLKEGNQIQFISAANGYGVTSLVDTLVVNEYVLLKHRADTQASGTQEREQEWTGGEESYRLVENDGITTLTVAFGVPTKMEEYFSVNFPKVMQRIKELAEKK